jgi:hypothetical protein
LMGDGRYQFGTENQISLGFLDLID